MKKINKLQLTKTSYLLVIAASISLFLLVVFFSYSLYGAKGTYSCETGETVDNDGHCICATDNVTANCTCPNGKYHRYINNEWKCTYGLVYFKDGTSTVSEKEWRSVSIGNSSSYFAVDSPDAPTKEGYKFNGWGTERDCTSGVTGVIQITSEQHSEADSVGFWYYYACWVTDCPVGKILSGNTCVDGGRAVFNHNNGTGRTETKTFTNTSIANTGSNYSVDVPSTNPTRDGYEFKGWGTNSSCTSGQTGTITVSAADYTAHGASDWNYYACWKIYGSRCYHCDGGSQYSEPKNFWAANNPDSNYCSLAGSESDCTNYVCWKHDNVTYSSTFSWSNSRPGSDYYIVDGIDDESECSSTTRYYVRLYQNKYNWKSGSDPKKVEYDDRMDITDFPALDTTDNVVWAKNADCSGTPIESFVDSAENHLSLYACPKSSGSNPGYVPPSGDDDPGDVPSNGGENNTGNDDDNNEQATNPGVAFSDEIKGDRCYKGKWVRVIKCQPESIIGAQCQLKDETLVLRKGDGLTAYSGCSELPDPYTDVIDDYRCDKSSGKWIYISSCQSSDLIGAQCKKTDGKIIRTYLTRGYGCSSSKPGSSNEGTSGGGSNDVNNPKTGTTEVIVSILVAAIALFVSWYYFKKNKVIEG